MSDNLGIKKEIDVLRKTLKEDKDYYIGWQANIAMAFKDEYWRYQNECGLIPSQAVIAEIHVIANNAAKNFLDLLIKE
jgi:hypothetical protein